MQILGRTKSDGLYMANASVLDDRWVEFTPEEPILVNKFSVPLDGLGPVNGDQRFLGVLRNASLETLAQTEIVIEDLSEMRWVDFVFPEPVLCRPGLLYSCWLLIDQTNNAARYGRTADYSLQAHVSYNLPWEPPYEVDTYLANLGYGSAQKVLAGAADPRTKRRVRASWHGTFIDNQPQGGSFAVAQIDSPAADLVGDRVKITAGQHSTYVYVHRAVDLDLDDGTTISLSRRAWQALAPLAKETLLVTTEVVP